jgi:hypothetical protein
LGTTRMEIKSVMASFIQAHDRRRRCFPEGKQDGKGEKAARNSSHGMLAWVALTIELPTNSVEGRYQRAAGS